MGNCGFKYSGLKKKTRYCHYEPNSSQEQMMIMNYAYLSKHQLCKKCEVNCKVP
jgi:hypothetical protein